MYSLTVHVPPAIRGEHIICGIILGMIGDCKNGNKMAGTSAAGASVSGEKLMNISSFQTLILYV